MPRATNTSRALARALKTHRERIAVYGDNGHREYGKVMAVLFPKGVRLRTPEDHARWHLVNMIVGKLCRYAANYDAGGHADSVHDLGVYAFILEGEDDHQATHRHRHRR